MYIYNINGKSDIYLFLIITVVCQNKQHKTPLTVNEEEIITKRAEVANQGNHRTYRQQFTCDSLKRTFKALNLDMRLFLSKIFTHLRTQGIEQEIVDLLQGRLPGSVFVRHYCRPNFGEESNRVDTLLTRLYQEIR
jgi:hypothetical protein